MTRPLLPLSTLALVLFGTLMPAALAQQNKDAQIARAVSAAPKSIGDHAAVAEIDEHGKITPLRSGSNGWTCIPHDPGTPLGHPLCLDKAGMEWMTDAMSGRIPSADKTGYSYMLQGGTSWSAVDVTAMALPPGQKHYITIPPHIMIMNAKIAQDSGFPSGETSPDTSKPFVIYGGTPYAILIIPIPKEPSGAPAPPEN